MKFNLQAINSGWSGIVNSYTQVFFSKNPLFAAIIILVTFFDLYAGMAGLIAVVFSNLAAVLLGLNRNKIKEGLYGFNSLLVGLGIGIYYAPGLEFYILLFFISLMTFFFTVGLEGILARLGLPFLSIPFLLGIWIAVIASSGYSALDISERGVYNLNDMYAIGGFTMVRLYEWFNGLDFPESLRIYFKSLSAILFQYHLFAGLLIGLGLLYYSRLAFLLSLIGFYSAFYFYQFIGADISELTYSYIGFNYILTAIAVGGFFIVPSRYSLLSVLILTPLVAITLSSTTSIFALIGLGVFSLPFNLIVLLFLFVLKFRENHPKHLNMVTVQQYAPEKNAYSYNSYISRFGNLPWVSMNLPFWGEWKVTQAHNGEHTHKDSWKYAWDFEIVDEEGKVHQGEGLVVTDYYCYNKPVTAPAAGTVEVIEDGIEDNAIGEMNLEQNWGNSVVIKHTEQLYSQVSHLRKASIKVSEGQAVKQGEVLGYCGNSGRSPIPHVHFQFQDTPSIGSKTLDYPFTSTISHKENGIAFQATANPAIDEVVSNAQVNELLLKAYKFLPGERLEFDVDVLKDKKQEWEVNIDLYGNSYLECLNTHSKAWFTDLGNVFYFTHFEGKKQTLLYYFYLSSFKVIKSFYPGLVLQDTYPLDHHPRRLLLFFQDFIIPFFRFLTATYKLEYIRYTDQSTKEIQLQSKAIFSRDAEGGTSINFGLRITDSGIQEFTIREKGRKITAIRKPVS